jgi:ribosomal protein S18 acetylase RimI-like enzyme
LKQAPGTTHSPLRLSAREERLAVCWLSPDQKVPSWATEAEFFSVTRTSNELSIVCTESFVPAGTVCERGWRALEIVGPLDFSLVGILAAITEPLAGADISVFAISTYDTDYILVREDALETAISTLIRAGHEVRDTNVTVRSATKDDEPFLWEMLYEAAHWGPEETTPKPPLDELLSEPGLSRYLEGWGRKNDFAVVARETGDGGRIGAAWYRTFPKRDHGYGFVDETTPEIALAVAPDRRGAGVGAALLDALMNAAYSNGFDAISLSVRKSNPVAMRLYEGKGFVRLRDDGDSWVMKAELPAGTTTNNARSAQ